MDQLEKKHVQLSYLNLLFLEISVGTVSNTYIQLSQNNVGRCLHVAKMYLPW